MEGGVTTSGSRCWKLPLILIILSQGVLVLIFVAIYQPDYLPLKFISRASEEIPFVPHVLRNVSDLSSILLGVGTVHYTPNGAPPIDPHTVLVGMGITSNKVNNLTSSNLQQKIPFFTILMPSFCKTCSRHFKYHFSIAYDFNDPKFSEAAFREAFTTQFRKITSEKCPTESTYDLIFVECPHHKRPAWAQNDAMIAGYMRNMAYYYRINDDTVMVTPGWTEAFIQGLAAMDPPNVGVVGPHHSGGNTAILTYDFVSFKHVEIFGFYYPRAFEDWHGDRWITDVYKPGRTHKLEKILLNHAMSLGQRYSRHYHNADQVKSQVAKDKTTLVRYLQALSTIQEKKITPSATSVISMSLAGDDLQPIYGAIRNAQLMTVHYPEWTLAIYVSSSKEAHRIPQLYLNKLKTLGARIIEVPKDIASLPPAVWKYLILDDPSVEVFLIRDPEFRLSDRERDMVIQWLGGQSPCFHCLRDHPSHKTIPVVDGLWGGVAKCVRQRLGDSMSNLLRNSTQPGTGFQLNDFLQSVVWGRLQGSALCHDSVSCGNWTGARPFPFLREGSAYLGARYDMHGTPAQAPGVLSGSSPDACNLSL